MLRKLAGCKSLLNGAARCQLQCNTPNGLSLRVHHINVNKITAHKDLMPAA